MNSLNKHRQMIWQSIPLFIASMLFLVIGSSQSVLAATVGEEFSVVDSLKKGSIVSLKREDPNQIELTTVLNSEYLLGVVNDSGNNIVTYGKENSEVAVSLSGIVQVFVTDVQGNIEKGDFIGASWLEGVGMKADVNEKQKLLGVALEDFDVLGASVYGDIETPDGKKQIRVGSITIRLFDKEATGDFASLSEAKGIESLLEKIAGRNVSFAKVIAVSVIFLMSVVVAGFFVSSSIRGSFISLGRNPRASASIYRSLIHVTMVAAVVILMGTMLSYVVLVL